MAKAQTAVDEEKQPEKWIALNKRLMTMTEEECFALLQEERDGQRRPQWLLRIHARFNKLRGERERTELISLEKK